MESKGSTEGKVEGEGEAKTNGGAFRVAAWNCGELSRENWAWVRRRLEEEDGKGAPLDVVLLCETKRRAADVEALFAEVADTYEWRINSHEPSCYHGVALLVRRGVPWRPLAVSLACRPRADCRAADATCGRLLAGILGEGAAAVTLVGTYVPNAGQRGKYLAYRTEQWDPALRTALDALAGDKGERPVLWFGDLNVALEDRDVDKPAAMRRARKPGFTDEERASYRRYFATAPGTSASLTLPRWVDVWRALHPRRVGYTHQGRAGARMRLDHAVASRALAPRITDARIVPMRGSDPLDHAALELTITSPCATPAEAAPASTA